MYLPACSVSGFKNLETAENGMLHYPLCHSVEIIRIVLEINLGLVWLPGVSAAKVNLSGYF